MTQIGRDERSTAELPSLPVAAERLGFGDIDRTSSCPCYPLGQRDKPRAEGRLKAVINNAANR